jgi:hypothetical protein
MLIILMIQEKWHRLDRVGAEGLAIIVLVPLLLVGLVPILTGAINWMNVTNLVPPTASLFGRQRRLEHWRLDAVPGRHVYRSLVDLRL